MLARHTSLFAEADKADGWPDSDFAAADASAATAVPSLSAVETLSPADALAMLGEEGRPYQAAATQADPFAAAVASASREAALLRSDPSAGPHVLKSRTKQTARKSMGGK